MEFIWHTPSIGNWIITLVLIVIVYALLFLVIYKVVKRKTGFVIWATSFVLILASYILCLDGFMVLVSMLSAVALTLSLFSNLGDLRSFLANPFRRASGKNVNFGIEKIYDRKALYKNIEATVTMLSKNRIGALITFEKNTSLKDIIKNGVMLYAPVTPELLMTIFYPGTRLHDGAVVIHGNEILAASVFFTPTTKPFAYKYGSRHRAAIGISEATDAVTVVVSEETGRISFAVNGELETVSPEAFLRAFETYMADGGNEE